MSVRQRAAAVLVSFGVVATVQAATFIVNKNTDDGSVNTLRWAIQQSNLAGGANAILIVARGVIKLNSLLPPIKGPALIKASGWRGSDYDPPSVALDGSNFIDTTTVNSCPAETSGFGPNVRSLQKPALAVVDSGGVDISGLEIRNFCIGVMLLRSHDNHIHHNLIHDTVGAAGILVTGDDGTAAGGATTGKSINNLIEYNVIYNTGDGMECTRGTSNTTYQYNLMHETRAGVAPYSQGIECAGSGNTGISILHNKFSGYSDGLQLNAANNVLVIGNTIENTTYGITASGAGVRIEGNLITGNRMGVGPGGNTSEVTITRNRIYDNGEPLLSLPTSAGGTTDPNSPALLGIDLGLNGVTPNQPAGSCGSAGPNSLQNHPILSPASTWQDERIALDGALSSCPNASYAVEFFANRSLNAAGFAEGEIYLGSIALTTDATGNASFHFRAALEKLLRDRTTQAYFTATATNSAGGTSEFSAALLLTHRHNDDHDDK